MDLESLRSGADTASSQASAMQASLPSVLTELKGSLNQIFNKDNPLVKERTGYLENYLSAGDKARASYLPQNSGFAYSPTELNALVSGRQASALAPLAGVNQMLVGQYGGLKDYLGQAKDLFQARTQAAYENAQRMRQQYGDAVARQQQEFENKMAQDKFNEDVRQFNAQESRLGKGSGISGLSGLSTTLNTPTSPKPTFNNWGGVGNVPYGPTDPRRIYTDEQVAQDIYNSQPQQQGLWESFVNKLYGRETTPQDQTIRNPLARGIRAAGKNFWNSLQGK